MISTYLVDWSRWQGALDAFKLEQAGFAGVWLKATGAKATSTTGPNPVSIDPFFYFNAAEVNRTSLLRGAFHYLMPGLPEQQAMTFYGAVRRAGGPSGWMCELDVEELGLTLGDLDTFVSAWRHLTRGYPLAVYTRKNYWTDNMKVAIPADMLHTAAWVPESTRMDPAQPYASQQAVAMPESAWDSYGGINPAMVQFSDHVLPYWGGPYVDASICKLSRDELRSLLVRNIPV